ncbi:MAG: cysteine desulfurase family protein [Acidimicrobiales bacterium]
MARHYLDHASTSPLRPEAKAAMLAELEAQAGDPGRVHEEGRAVRTRLEDARAQIADALGVRPRQVILTSGGTEAINAAVFGATRSSAHGRIALAKVEHSAVRDASDRAGRVVEIAVDRVGRIDLESLADAVRSSHPALVHCQWANHEVGTLQPVQQAVAICRDAGVPIHVDACCALGQADLDLGSLHADLVSLSAHKAGGPAGIGALVISPTLRLEPFIVGGQQERARRGGMENVAAAAGFGALCTILSSPGRLGSETARATANAQTVLRAATGVDGVEELGDPDPAGRLASIVCISVKGVEAEPVVVGLDRLGVAVHSGSACSSEALEPSPVLAAMGVDADHSLRVSVGWSTTHDDVAAFTRHFGTVVAGLRSLRS